jgi:RNA polymerase sigma-32 factor
MKAVKRFDTSLGVRLATFAMKWIKAEIHEFVIKNWRIVKLATTKAQRKLFFKLRSAKKQLAWLSYQEAQGIAADLGVSVKDVNEMEARLYGTDIGFDRDEDDHAEQYALPAPAHFLADDSQNVAASVIQSEQDDNISRLHAAIRSLDPRSQIIVTRRFLEEEKATLQELASEFNISVERVRQLEEKARKDLKAILV